jgi:hypothetical protein
LLFSGAAGVAARKMDRPFGRHVFILGTGQTYSTYTFILRRCVVFFQQSIRPGVCLGIVITWGYMERELGGYD